MHVVTGGRKCFINFNKHTLQLNTKMLKKIAKNIIYHVK
jgi:hypothetical protein